MKAQFSIGAVALPLLIVLITLRFIPGYLALSGLYIGRQTFIGQKSWLELHKPILMQLI